MDWENERYVRLYTRSTVDDSVLSWQSRALWHELLRKFDRSGVIDMGRHGSKGLSALVGIPMDIVTVGVEELIADGRVSISADKTRLVAPNFLEAQEARQSNKLRQAKSRESRRAMSQNVTNSNDSSHDVTSGHTVSQPVTPSLAKPSLPTAKTSDRTASVVSESMLVEVYELYPVKKGRASGLAKAKKVIKTLSAFEAFKSCVEAMARDFAEDSTYCPHFSTFVNGRLWEDAHPPSPNKPQSSTPGLSAEEIWAMSKDPTL